ncbi:ankyrin repeat domain-containing protein [Chryseobacterium chendengshani]|uniref:ankyrin repeat domain-containing protein n=1 Tax=Chryseobacterium sp. LJ756 TaxID=2864113 RepID=UPI001C63DD08|nr:ankyrin repeat domain-containing protein [Chryseobacterium sp. LJ756]MBW7675797.1 ankyrin repeat domain-containing protein [Chryseobacterium sp. LJ756]
MKKIIITSVILGFSAFANLIFAQQVTGVQRQAIQSDNIQKFKAAFTKADYDKCLSVKDASYTMLSYSALNNKKNISEFLISNKADVNKACDGVTPLMNAAMFGQTAMVKMLLAKGADKNVKDANGLSAKDYALKYNFSAVATMLK